MNGVQFSIWLAIMIVVGTIVGAGTIVIYTALN